MNKKDFFTGVVKESGVCGGTFEIDPIEFITYKGKTYELKDLEVLDLIKKHYRVIGSNDLMPIITHNYEQDTKDFNIIREWLKQ